MSRKVRCSLTDEHGGRIAPHFPSTRPPRGGRPRADDRGCLEGVLGVLRSGGPLGGDIPADLPSGSTCWQRLQEWAGDGVL
jgi:transposase